MSKGLSGSGVLWHLNCTEHDIYLKSAKVQCHYHYYCYRADKRFTLSTAMRKNTGRVVGDSQ